jgi:acyl-coenzyme A thioesterase PaaI-like protein
MNPTLFRHGINLWPPFLLAGIHVTRVSRDFRDIDVELRMRPWNRNYVGTHFGGSLFAMTDPFWMFSVLRNLGSRYFVWDKAAEIEFVKPGKGTVGTSFHLDEATLDELRARAADGGKVLHWFENEITDAKGEVVARVRKQVYVRLKPAARTPAG